MRHLRFHTHPDLHSQSFLLQRVQPGLSGLMDGSLSTLAPIFAVVLATHPPLTAFYTGLATTLGAGVSMAFSEGLSDTGDLTGRGKPVVRGAITGGGTFLGGVFHTLPFLISDYQVALVLAVIVVSVELFILVTVFMSVIGRWSTNGVVLSSARGRLFELPRRAQPAGTDTPKGVPFRGP